MLLLSLVWRVAPQSPYYRRARAAGVKFSAAPSRTVRPGT